MEANQSQTTTWLLQTTDQSGISSKVKGIFRAFGSHVHKTMHKKVKAMQLINYPDKPALATCNVRADETWHQSAWEKTV